MGVRKKTHRGFFGYVPGCLNPATCDVFVYLLIAASCMMCYCVFTGLFWCQCDKVLFGI